MYFAHLIDHEEVPPMHSRLWSVPRGVGAVPAAALYVGLALAGCKTEQPQAPQTCCDQPKIPPGVPAFTVVRDEATGPTDGQDVKIHVALKQKTKRDDIYPALQFLYRYAMTRDTFEPTNFVGAFYTTRGRGQDRRQRRWRKSGASAATRVRSARTRSSSSSTRRSTRRSRTA